MTKDLFIKYLQGNCTEREFEQILLWIREGSLTTAGKGMVQEVWNEFEPEAGPTERIKYNRILDQIHHQININQEASQLQTKRALARNRILYVITRVAAILLLPALILLFYTNIPDKNQYAENTNDLEVVSPAGSQVHIVLGDGTKVWLNHGSKLKYPYRFVGKDRKVFLTGEAYFEVAHNKAIPFIVRTNRLDVKATGTAFNVSAYPDDDVIEATLVEGKVILYASDSHCKIKALSPSDCFKFNSKKNVYSLDSVNTEKYTAWKDGFLVFKNDPIEIIAKKLSRWYNVDVKVTDEKINGFTCTATFTDETLSQVLELMALVTPIDYTLTQQKKLPDSSFSKREVLIGSK